jgi:hypothetical protein
MICGPRKTNHEGKKSMIRREMSVQGYANVIKPDGATEWLDRVTFVVRIPDA